MPPKAGQPGGDAPADAGPDAPPKPDAGGWNFNIFAPLGAALENGLESSLDAVVGPAELPDHGKPKAKKRHKSKRQKDAEKIPQVDFEREIADKAAELAERMRKEEEELEDSLRRRKEAAVDNYQQIVQSTLVQVGGLYAVSQACLLVIFVPQKCPLVTPCSWPPQYNCDGVKLTSLAPDLRDEFLADPSILADCCTQSSLFDYTTYAPDGHLCTMKENLDWENCSVFNQSVLVLNLVTLFIMLMAQSFFWKREVWMINHLEEDNTVPYSSLPEQIQPYEDLEATNKSYNRSAYFYALAVMVSVLCNFGVSTYFLIKGDDMYNYNIGSRTITGLLTNTMLVSTKVIGYFSYARLSKTHDWAISMFSVIPVSYNVVDENYALHHVKPEEATL